MCRLFAQVSTKPRTAKDFLVDSDTSLLHQADGDSTNPQKDGWGVAWFDPSGRPRLRKSGGSAAVEGEQFTRAALEADSSIVLGHLRAASNPHRDASHAHPFEDEGWVFIHNGTLTIAGEVAEALGSRKARLRTKSDSEVYFQQFLKHVSSTKDPSLAFEECIRENWRLWESCRASYSDATTPYTSLNAIASNGRGVHALCHASRRGTADCGVFHRDQAWSVMSFSVRDGRVALASEGVDGGDWTRLNPPETFSAVAKDDRVEVRRRSLSLTSRFGAVPEVSRT
jgi:predicted glutamine amidotransferase